MDKKTLDISLFISRNEELRLEELSKKFNKSERSIRNDIDSINDFLRKNNMDLIVLKNGLVFLSLNENQIKEAFNKLDYYDYTLDIVERTIIIIIYGLIFNEKFIISDLSRLMNVSRSTVKKDFSRVKSFIKNYGFKLKSEPAKGNILVCENECDINNLLLDLLNYDINNVERFFYQELNIDINNIGNIELSNYLDYMYSMITEIEHNTSQYLTKTSKRFLVLYLLIYLVRVMNKKESKDTNNVKVIKNIEYKNFGDKLIYSIENGFDIKLNQEERNLINRLINKLNFQVKKYENDNLLKIQFLTRRLIERISKEIEINLNQDEELLRNLSKHLSSIVQNRIKKIEEFDHITEIANEYPEIIEVVEKSLTEIEKVSSRELSNIEIHFIVVYIVASIEKLKNQIKDINILIVCNEGIATSFLIKEKIKRIVPGTNQFIANKYNYTSELERLNPDIIVSNITLDDSVEYIYIKNITVFEELKVLNEKVDRIKLDKIKNFGKIERKDNYIDYKYNDKQLSLTEMLPKENIKLNINVKNWEDAIEEASKVLLEKDYINKEYVKGMIDNIKRYGPYVVVSESVAIPHASSDSGALKTGMSLIKLKDEIKFGDEEEATFVKYIICLVSVNNEHFDAFFSLVNGLQNAELKKKFMNAKTSKEIFNILEEMEDKNI